MRKIDFYREATLRIFSTLDIEQALFRTLGFIKEHIPADELLVSVYDYNANLAEIVAFASVRECRILSAGGCAISLWQPGDLCGHGLVSVSCPRRSCDPGQEPSPRQATPTGISAGGTPPRGVMTRTGSALREPMGEPTRCWRARPAGLRVGDTARLRLRVDLRRKVGPGAPTGRGRESG